MFHVLCDVSRQFACIFLLFSLNSQSFAAYDPDAPKESRRSTMSIIAKMEDGTYYPTTAAIDPFFRAPQLGEYEDM